MYELILTRKAQKFYEQVDDVLTERLNRCFEQLQANPYNHPNIKRLRGFLRVVCAIESVTGEWFIRSMKYSKALRFY